MLLGIILLFLIICIIGISVYNRIKVEKIQKIIQAHNNEIEKDICSCNKNIEAYNTIIKNFNMIYKDVGLSEKLSETLQLCQNLDIESNWINVKEVIGIKVFLPETYRKISRFASFQQSYEKWCKKYKKNIVERNDLVVQRIKELNEEWSPLSNIVDKINENYPPKIKECISGIVNVLLLNRESNFKLEREILEFKCARGEDFGIG